MNLVTLTGMVLALLGSTMPDPIAPVPSTTYRFLFDANSPIGPDGRDASLREVAAFEAMYEAAGVPSAHLKFVIVLHGSRTQTVLTDEAYAAAHGGNRNPNIETIEALLKKHVRVIAAGASDTEAQALATGVESGPISNMVFLDLENAGYIYTGTRNLSTE